MYAANAILFLYVETPLHAGAGQALGVVDQPIQREQSTGLPIIQATGIKGRLRYEGKPDSGSASNRFSEDEFLAIFGPDTQTAGEHAGALAVGDAQILLFPVRSMEGVFAWTTSCLALERFLRTVSKSEVSGLDKFAAIKIKDSILIGGDDIKIDDKVVLEELAFAADESKQVRDLGEWLAENALPSKPGEGIDPHEYLREKLPQRLCLLSDEDFRDFCLYSTEVRTHVSLDPKTKTSTDKALWMTESLPSDCLLYVPLMATPSRKANLTLSAQELIDKVQNWVDQELKYTRLGGNETTGQGVVALRTLGERL